MNQTRAGWMMFIASIGMMFGLLSSDVASLKDWHELFTPLFIGTAMGHIAVVITAFVGGKMIPINNSNIVSERKLQELNK